jgi:opacity protein-like surface antigen
MRKKLIRCLLVFGLLTATIPAANAQFSYIEPEGFAIGMNFGMTDLWGDVGTQSVIDHYTNDQYTNNINFTGGMFGRYTIHPAACVRFGVNYGVYYATDKWNEDLAFGAQFVEDDAFQRYLRNQTVKTNIWEGNVMLEVNLFRFGMGEYSNLAWRKFTPYFLVGLGYFHYNARGLIQDPTGYYANIWTDLYPLNLEGDGWFGTNNQAERESRWGMQVPLGIGMKWDLGKRFNLGIEYLYRYTFKDQIDGVSGEYIDPALFDQNLSPQQASQARALHDRSHLINPLISHAPGEFRGNPSVKDAYSSIAITMYFKLKRKTIPWWMP